MKQNEMKAGKVVMMRLEYGADLLAELTRAAVKHNVALGEVRAIGAVQRARIGFYDQQQKEYGYEDYDEAMEILNLMGNISQKDDEIFVHAHVTLAGKDGRAVGGHLAEGTVIFACEAVLMRYDGARMERHYDDQTGLTLWS